MNKTNQIVITYQNGDKLATKINRELKKNNFAEYKASFDVMEGLLIWVKNGLVPFEELELIQKLLKKMGLKIYSVVQHVPETTCLYIEEDA